MMSSFDSSNAKPETPFMDILYWSRFRMRVIGRSEWAELLSLNDYTSLQSL